MIEQSLTRYRELVRLSADIEQAIADRNTGPIPALCEAMNARQEEAKALDGAVLARVRERRDSRETENLRELLALMREIQERNHRLLSQVNGIMAVQRHELQKLRNGNTLLQGYQTAAPQTGRRISSSN